MFDKPTPYEFGYMLGAVAKQAAAPLPPITIGVAKRPDITALDPALATIQQHSDARLGSFLHGLNPGSARYETMQAMLSQGYKPQDDRASRMYYERAMRGKQPVVVLPTSQSIGPHVLQDLVRSGIRDTSGRPVPVTIPQTRVNLPNNLENFFREHKVPIADKWMTLRHETEHTQQGAQPLGGSTDPAEIGPSLGDVIHLTNAYHGQQKKPLEHRVVFPDGYAPTAAWMARATKRHGGPNRNMDELLGTAPGAAWLEQRKATQPVIPAAKPYRLSAAIKLLIDHGSLPAVAGLLGAGVGGSLGLLAGSYRRHPVVGVSRGVVRGGITGVTAAAGAQALRHLLYVHNRPYLPLALGALVGGGLGWYGSGKLLGPAKSNRKPTVTGR